VRHLQVNLVTALVSSAFPRAALRSFHNPCSPLDVLGAESQGVIGYLLA
jgi:carbamate kinase